VDSFVSLKINIGIRIMQIEKIVYFCSENGKTYVKYCDGLKEMVYCSLNKLEKTLNNLKFFRIHESYLLNMGQELIFCSQERKVILPNGEKLDVARDRKKDFIVILMNGSK